MLCAATDGAGCIAWVLANSAETTTGGAALVAGANTPEGQAILQDLESNSEEATGEASALGGGGSCNSFRPDTWVLLPNGSRAHIRDIRAGDFVLSEDPATRLLSARLVLATMAHRDDDLLDLNVFTSNGTSTIHTTSHHLVWSELYQKWVMADTLRSGSLTRTSSGAPAIVTKVSRSGGRAMMLDLTVAVNHTFFVSAGKATPILVHNRTAGACGGSDPTNLRTLLHGADTLRSSASYTFWQQQKTEYIIDSLRPGSTLPPLLVNQSNIVVDGNTRILILMERGVDIDKLPAQLYTPMHLDRGVALTRSEGTRAGL